MKDASLRVTLISASVPHMMNRHQGRPAPREIVLRALASALALGLVSLGGLWFLQGSGLVTLDPIACVGTCSPLRGWQPAWQAAGAVLIAVGIGAVWLSWRAR